MTVKNYKNGQFLLLSMEPLLYIHKKLNIYNNLSNFIEILLLVTKNKS